jgi:hypothetical protein
LAGRQGSKGSAIRERRRVGLAQSTFLTNAPLLTSPAYNPKGAGGTQKYFSSSESDIVQKLYILFQVMDRVDIYLTGTKGGTDKSLALESQQERYF